MADPDKVVRNPTSAAQDKRAPIVVTGTEAYRYVIEAWVAYDQLFSMRNSFVPECLIAARKRVQRLSETILGLNGVALVCDEIFESKKKSL